MHLLLVFRRTSFQVKRRGIQCILYTSLLTSASFAGTTTVIFNPYSVSGGPFPTNALATADSSTRTGLRVNLNSADENTCLPSGHASVCSNASLLNTLDGFSINPRAMACFSSDISYNTIAQGIQIVPVNAPSTVIPLNQIVYDQASHCAYGKPDHVLDQRTSYLLLVTSALLDASGHKVKDDGGYRACLKGGTPYCQALAAATNHLVGGGSDAKIASASLFTTMSTTSWLQGAYAEVAALPVVVVPAGFPYSFDLADIQKLTWTPSGSSLPPQDIPLPVLSGVKSISFGVFLSPNYLNPGLPSPGTITVDATTPLGLAPVSFHVFLPNIPNHQGPWPVVIYGHGLSDNQFGAPTFMASTLAKNGFATVAMEITGHGYGLESTVTVASKATNGTSSTVMTPGRGILLPGASTIGAQDGCIVPGALAIRDCGRQTAIDLFALVQAIKQTNGLGLNLDPGRIYYVGQSFGSIYGSLFHAIEPSVSAAVINAGGGTFTDIARLAITGRPLGEAFLASQGLLNVLPGMGYSLPPTCQGNCFNDDYAFRNQPPVLSSNGATEIQAAFEAAEWLGMLGDPLAFAPHFKTSPLPGVPAKKTLFQFGLGDLEVPNPTESALVRAADGLDLTWLLRFDRVVQKFPELAAFPYPSAAPFPILPHRILSNLSVGVGGEPNETSISLAEQQQVASFFAASGTQNPDPNTFLQSPSSPSFGFFEKPVALPEMLNFAPHF